MSFVNMYGLMDFDDAGHIKPVYKDGQMIVGLKQAQSNYLYMLTKYNRNFLIQKKEKPSDFFRKDLSQILQDVEKGGDYSAALQTIMDNCVSEIKDLSRLTMATEKGLLMLLNEMTPLVGSVYEKMKFGEVKNTLEENYKLNKLAATYEDAIDKRIADYLGGEGSLEDKQTIFNSLVNLNIAYAKLIQNDKMHAEGISTVAATKIQTQTERAFA